MSGPVVAETWMCPLWHRPQLTFLLLFSILILSFTFVYAWRIGAGVF